MAKKTGDAHKIRMLSHAIFNSPFPIYICDIKFFWLHYLSCFQHSDKSGNGFPKIIHHISVGAHQAELFLNKCSL